MVHLQDYEFSGGHAGLCGKGIQHQGADGSTLLMKSVTCPDCLAPDAREKAAARKARSEEQWNELRRK